MSKLDDILSFVNTADTYDEKQYAKQAIIALMLETYCKAQDMSPVKEPIEFTEAFNELVEAL